ncbi:MAG: methyltransferase domain-containing protein [Candidatus Lokiarchaeota archaeon]|nr:methyltransferase domain-containing protein [Candidatus Lokiarchaeota archaeon]
MRENSSELESDVSTNNLNLKNKKTLGPIKNLESYLNLNWWCEIFNSNYLKTDGDIVNDNQITTQEVSNIIEILGIDEDDKILDLCCGHGRHSLEFARRGFKNIYGFDKSSYLIRKARQSALKENLNSQFREGDARKISYSTDTFDIVLLLGNSFGYFESIQDDFKVLEEIIRILKPWGKIFLDLADGEFLKNNYQPRSWEWIDKNLFVCRERSLSLDKERLITREVITNVNKGVIADQIYAERLYTLKKIESILKKIGFSNIICHGDLISSTHRNQDLGMMERRLLISAQIKKEWTPKKPKKVLKNIAVLMGDPKKIDNVKPNNSFDEDDIYTIDQLKSALKDLDSFNFMFYNNHDILIWELIKNKKKIDYIFNLCDEGFNNDARKELHIAALLEMLDIPYTGSGPQCLAFCYDKSLVRGIAKEMDIPVADGIYIKEEDLAYTFLPFNFPVLVKPNLGDSSYGITQRNVVNNKEELINVISELRVQFGYSNPLLIEEYLTGADISVGIIGNPPELYKVLPIIEEDYSSLPDDLPRICGYEAKWMPNSPYWKITSKLAQISEESKNLIIDCCLKLFKRLECRDYCRFDWRFDKEGNPKLLEVNPNPGWCWDGHLAKMAKFDNLSYSKMIEEILLATENRIGFMQNNQRD